MNIVKGSTFKLKHTVYADFDSLSPADITAATISVMFKKNEQDPDSGALFTKAVGSGVTITNGSGGLCETVVAATDTNSLSLSRLYFEILVKTSSGDHIRSGIERIEMDVKLIKTLN